MYSDLKKDFESQLIRNEIKELETWAIYWYQYIFLNGDYVCTAIEKFSSEQRNGWFRRKKKYVPIFTNLN